MLTRVLHHHTFSLPPRERARAHELGWEVVEWTRPLSNGAGLVLGCPLFKIASLALAWRVFMLLVWRLLHHPLACTLYFYPVYTAQPRPCRVLPPLTSTWGFHVADAAHRGITMPSVCPTPFNISNAYPSHAVESPCVLPYHLPRLLPAPYTGAMSLHIATTELPSFSLPLHPSCLRSLLLPRLHCHGPASSPLTSTWGFHVADAAHRGITMPSVCPTPFNISNAYPIPAPSSHSGTYLISCLHPILAPCPTACPLLTLGMPHSRCSTPALLHLLPAPSHCHPK